MGKSGRLNVVCIQRVARFRHDLSWFSNPPTFRCFSGFAFIVTCVTPRQKKAIDSSRTCKRVEHQTMSNV